jgi:hypothetical protein
MPSTVGEARSAAVASILNPTFTPELQFKSNANPHPSNGENQGNTSTAQSRPATAPLTARKIDLSLSTVDIPGAQSSHLHSKYYSAYSHTHLSNFNNSLATPRNPLQPEYKLPSVEMRPVTPPKFLKDSLDNSDILGSTAFVRQNFIETRENQLNVRDINKKAQPRITEHDKRLDVSDIAARPAPSLTQRHINPLEPHYSVATSTALNYENLAQFIQSWHLNGTNEPQWHPNAQTTVIGPVQGSRPASARPAKPSHQQFSLNSADINTRTKKTLKKLHDFQLNITDIEGTQANSRRTMFKTGRINGDYSWDESSGLVHIERHVLDNILRENSANSVDQELKLAQLSSILERYRQQPPEPHSDAAGSASCTQKYYYLPGNKRPKLIQLLKEWRKQKQEQFIQSQLQRTNSLTNQIHNNFSPKRINYNNNNGSTNNAANQMSCNSDGNGAGKQIVEETKENLAENALPAADALASPNSLSMLINSLESQPSSSRQPIRPATAQPSTANQAPHSHLEAFSSAVQPKNSPISAPARPQSAYPSLLQQKRQQVAETEREQRESAFLSHAAQFAPFLNHLSNNPIINPAGYSFSLVPAATKPNQHKSGKKSQETKQQRNKTSKSGQSPSNQLPNFSTATSLNLASSRPISALSRPLTAHSARSGRNFAVTSDTMTSLASTQLAATPRRSAWEGRQGSGRLEGSEQKARDTLRFEVQKAEDRLAVSGLA